MPKFNVQMMRHVPVTIKVTAKTAMEALEKASHRADRRGWETGKKCRIYDENMNAVDPYARTGKGE